ncbi:MAG TPA: PLP-dependent transferase [Bacteroidales bacterium]|nr:PLP-dependent transferase [Bacteroidales bacterium]
MNYQHSKYLRQEPFNALQVPVYQSVAFEFNTAEEMEAAFTGKSAEHCYSRITNPTVQFFEERIRNISGATNVTALNSGMAAISNAMIALAYSGANIVTSPHLFGNTYSFFNSTLAAFGVETRFCDLTNLDEVKSCMDENTCALFLEVITNPQLEVVDLKALSQMAHEAGVPLVADTTVVPFCAWSAKNFGVDIELISSTKYISGGATSLGGLILDYANFDWSRSPKLRDLSKQMGPNAFHFKLRREIHRNLGAYMTPQVAYQQTLGLETLPLRFERASKTCLELAERLQSLEGIVSVNYTGLASNPFAALSNKQFGPLPGAMLTFDLESREKCFAFMNRLKLIKRATNLFDNKSLAIHPASTIFGTFTAAIREEMDVRDTTIRLSVGLEDVEELLDDIQQSLKNS